MGTFRFLLALSVALSHFGTVWGYHIMNGRMAVQCFYMISGFLISLVLSQKYDPTTTDGRLLFYTNRALRIFVPYWSFCLIIVAAHALIYVALGIRFGLLDLYVQHWAEMTLGTRIYLLFSNIFILTQEWSMWLVYQNGAIVSVWNSDFHVPHLGDFQLIPQAWSVSLELMFYAIAPFLVRRHWLTLVAIIVASYLVRWTTFTHGFNGSGFIYRFFPFEIALFLAGVLSHRVYAHLVSRGMTNVHLSWAVWAILISLVLAQGYIERLDNHWFYVLVAVALPALFVVSQRMSADRWLGDLSYPIYLAHGFVLHFGSVVTTTLIGPVENQNWFALNMLAITILITAAYVHWIDAPFERWRQRRATRVKQKRAPEGFVALAQNRILVPADR